MMKILSLTLGLLLSCAFLPSYAYSSSDRTTPNTYSVRIPDFTWVYKIPPELGAGYGPKESVILFSDIWEGKAAFSIHDGLAYGRHVSSFYHGGKANSRDFDMRVGLLLLMFDKSKSPIWSVDELKLFLRSREGVVLIDRDNKKIKTDYVYSVEMIAGRKVVKQAETRESMNKGEEIVLKAGFIVHPQPTDTYYYRVSEGLAIGVMFSCNDQDKFSSKWQRKAKGMVEYFIKNMTFTPESIRDDHK